jgi:glyoxylase-like metal-dependent hydrolase (beta-lactamase superfamily II)
MEIVPGFHLLKIPIPDNSLGFINAYLVKTDEGSLLVDTGWNTEEAFNSLEKQILDAGSSWADLRYIVITHVHPDHYGLAGRLAKLTSAELIIHAIERSFLDRRYVKYDSLVVEMDEWLRMNGAPDSIRSSMSSAGLAVLGLVTVSIPNRIVRGGERLNLGGLDFEILWTPGHSAGHICLYEQNRRILISGDHILPRITSNISMHTQSVGNPLADYLNSLDHLAHLPVDWVLPAHGEPFRDLPGRIGEIISHYQGRLQEILNVLAKGEHTAFQVTETIRWSTGKLAFSDLPPIHKRMAMTETLAHLELLYARGEVEKYYHEELVWYSIAPNK